MKIIIDTSDERKKSLSPAEIIVNFFTDEQNNGRLKALAELTRLGAEVFISGRNERDPYSKDLVMPGKSPLKFYSMWMSQIGIIMPSNPATGGNLYRFTLGELRIVTPKGEKEACTINLNNAIFFEAAYEYLAPLSLLVKEYDAYDPLKTNPNEGGWFKDFNDALKTNGGLELIEQWKELRIQKNKEVRAQKYAEAAEIRDRENVVLSKLEEILDKYSDSLSE